MSFIRNIHESLFPSEREARVAREHAAQTRARLSDARVKRIEAKERVSEAMERLVEKELAVAESYQWVGQPYQAEWAGLSLDEAYRRGLPDLQLAFQYDATQVANNDSLRNEMLKVCRILYSSHPHAKAVIDTAKAFVVGPHAWQVEPLPKINERPESVRPVSEDDQDYVAGRIPPVSKVVDPNLPPPGEEDDPREEKQRVDFKRLRKIKPAWDRWQKRGHIHPKQDWVEFWDEAWMRSRRDGEVFIHLGHNKKNGALSPRFLEPEEIVHPTGGMSSNVKGTFDKDMCGIRVDEDDPQTVIGYWWRPIWKLGEQPELLPADDVIHIKIGADSGARRGLPALFCVRHMLRHFDTWIQQSLKHQKIQSMIAVLRQWDKATPDAVSNFQASNVFRSTNMSTPAGNNFNYNTQQLLPFVDAPRGMTMNPFVPAGNYGDSEILARRVLLAVAAGENMSECMVTSDAANANYACHDEQTEVSTFRGWKRFDQVSKDDLIATLNPKTHRLEYQRPTEVHNYWHEGKMVKFTGAHNLDMLVTANHRMYVREKQFDLKEYRFGEWKFASAGEIAESRASHSMLFGTEPWTAPEKSNDYFILPGIYDEESTKYNPHLRLDRKIKMSSWVKFLGYWISEGYLCVSDGRCNVGVSQKMDSPCYKDIAQTLTEMSEINWNEYQNPITGMASWHLCDKRLFLWLEKHGGKGAYNKHLPDLIKSLDSEHAQMFLQCALNGDGSRRKNNSWMYFTISPRLADDMQELGLKLGYVSHQRKKMKNGVIPITFRFRRNTCINPRNHTSYVDYKGYVGCVTVPNGLVVTRRNGRIAVSGNSSRIAQIPAFRGFEATQGRWSGRVELVYHRWLATEAILGRQDAVTEECQLDCHVTPNPLPPFEMENTFGMITSLYGSGLITKRTAQEKLGIDLQMEEEREGKEQAKAAAQIAPFQPTETDEEPDLADDEEEPEEVEPVIPESRPVLNRLYEYLTGAKRNGTH